MPPVNQESAVHHYSHLSSGIGEAVARIRQAQEMAAGGTAALHVRRPQEIANLGVPGYLRNAQRFQKLLDPLQDRPVESTVDRTTAPCDDDRDDMRRFILQQMTEAKDEAAKAAFRRYLLRNRLLVVVY